MPEQNTLERLDDQISPTEERHLDLFRSYTSQEDEGAYLRAYWGVIRSRRWTVLSALLIVVVLVAIYTVREKPVYQATSMVEIEQENPNILTVQQLFQIQTVSDNYLNTQYKILRSDSLARQVIQKLHLDQVKEFNTPKITWPWKAKDHDAAGDSDLSTDASHEQRVLQNFEDRLRITPVPRSRLVEVAFNSHDPKLAASVVNTLISSYIHQNLLAHWQASQQASTWLSTQLDALKIKLEKSEDYLQQYAQANGLLFLESAQGQHENIVNQRLRELQDELTQTQAELYQKESLFHLVQAGDYGALPGVFDNKMIQELTVRLAGLEQQKAQLSPNFNSSYPKVKEIQSQIDQIQGFLKQQQNQGAHNIEDAYWAAKRRAALVSQAFAQQQKQANVVAEKSVEYNILKREVDSNKQLYEGLLQRMKEAGVSAGLKASNIRVVDSAVPPVRPAKPRMALNLGLGLFVGLTFGVGFAFLQERMDNTLKTPDDVEVFLRMPALAMIPTSRASNNHENGHRKSLPQSPWERDGETTQVAVKKESRNGWPRVDSQLLSQSPISEAFRSLCTSVLLSSATHPPRSLVFVSAEPSEGKTTICSNLAISLARLGKRVLVVDGDLRRPSVHQLFHLPNSAGLVNYLTNNDSWPALVQPTGLAGLECLVCGPVPPNPTELLFSVQMRTLIEEATGSYDHVLVDAPPLLSVADGRILSKMVEGTILVVKGGNTPREMVRRAEIDIAEIGGRVIGVVLNDVNLRRDGYYYSRYDYSSCAESSESRAEA